LPGVFSIPTSIAIRRASCGDCAAIAGIYNEAIAERRSTFETEPRSPGEIRAWLDEPCQPVLVAELGQAVIGWARIGSYSSRRCYAGIGEASVYIAREQRGRGVGTALAHELGIAGQQTGYHKLLGKLFTDNEASRKLVRRCGPHSEASD
jgi:phosphinothricin acetyltransferase